MIEDTHYYDIYIYISEKGVLNRKGIVLYTDHGRHDRTAQSTAAKDKVGRQPNAVHKATKGTTRQGSLQQRGLERADSTNRTYHTKGAQKHGNFHHRKVKKAGDSTVITS